ncbi:MAG: lysozyme inhibitor LprI family protein [Pseudomonadota bacterium]
MKRFLASSLLVLPLCGAPAFAASTFVPSGAPYPNTSAMGVEVDSGEQWYQQCVGVQDSAPPPQDLPPAKSGAALSRCVAPDLYYDALSANGARADWETVRHCAFAQRDTGVLMMLYANGLGVPKNPKLALKYACSLPSAQAEMSGRVEHLVSRMLDNTAGRFDLCDDITSGRMQGECTAVGERQDAKVRNRDLAAIIKTWPPQHQTGLRELQKTMDSFAIWRAQAEVDAGGTLAASFAIDAKAAELALFIADLRTAEKGKAPGFSEAGFMQLDKQLNVLYQKIMERPPAGQGQADSDAIFGTVNKDGVRSVQRAWLAYRDAWVRFGALRYPAVKPWAWKARLTERRIKQLAEFDVP